MSYDCAVIFKKFTNLMPYFNGIEGNTPGHECARACYAKERMVNLILLIRREYDYTTATNHVFCKIKCPINPLPVKGEFEAPSVNAVEHFLRNMGWVKNDVLYNSLLE